MKKTKQKTKKPAPLRQRRSGFSPSPGLPWLHRGTSIASEASHTLFRCLQFSKGESEGGKPAVGAPLGPKKSLARGHAALARPQQEKRLLGCRLRIRSATLGPPHSASLTTPTSPPRAQLGRFPFLCFSFFLFFFFPVSVPAGQAKDPLPGRQRPLSPPAVPAAGLRPIAAPLTCPRVLLAPALPGPLPSFLKPLCL